MSARMFDGVSFCLSISNFLCTEYLQQINNTPERGRGNENKVHGIGRFPTRSIGVGGHFELPRALRSVFHAIIRCHPFYIHIVNFESTVVTVRRHSMRTFRLVLALNRISPHTVHMAPEFNM